MNSFSHVYSSSILCSVLGYMDLKIIIVALGTNRCSQNRQIPLGDYNLI
jgi:hypothetical protein